jgi:hypothetical protein
MVVVRFACVQGHGYPRVHRPVCHVEPTL